MDFLIEYMKHFYFTITFFT